MPPTHKPQETISLYDTDKINNHSIKLVINDNNNINSTNNKKKNSPHKAFPIPKKKMRFQAKWRYSSSQALHHKAHRLQESEPQGPQIPRLPKESPQFPSSKSRACKDFRSALPRKRGQVEVENCS